MAVTMASVSAMLKEMYETKLQDQLLSETTTLRRLEQTSEGVTQDAGGKYVVFPVKTGRNTGVGARAEMEALPTAGQQGRNVAKVGLRYLYGSIELAGQTFELANSNPQSFMSIVDDEMTGIKDDLAVDLNRQIYGDGSGAMASITAAVTASTFTVKHTVWLQLNSVVDVYDSTGVTLRAAGRVVTGIVNSVGNGTGTVTLSGAAITVSVGDIIVRTGNVGNATTQREWTGLGKIVQSSGSLYQLTDPVWQAVVDSNGGTARSLTENLITKTVDKVRTNGSYPTVMFLSLGVRRSYTALLQAQRQFVNTKEFTGGFSGIAYVSDKGEIPMVVDTMVPPGTIYGLNEKAIKWYRQHDFQFMSRDGEMWERKIGYDAYFANLYQYSEIGTHRRNSHFMLSDITES